jgi:hypothetical protein
MTTLARIAHAARSRQDSLLGGVQTGHHPGGHSVPADTRIIALTRAARCRAQAEDGRLAVPIEARWLRLARPRPMATCSAAASLFEPRDSAEHLTRQKSGV